MALLDLTNWKMRVKGPLAGKVKEATGTAVEDVLNRIADEQAATPRWLEIVTGYEQIIKGQASSPIEG